ncbi:MAG: fucose pyrophosphorylase domain-containing protein [Opitutales bacterium]
MARFLQSEHAHARTLVDRAEHLSGGAVRFGHDPGDRRLGSGGGTVHALWSAWQAKGGADHCALETWLRQDQRLVLHAGGESRRLPAYGPEGKIFCPVPPLADRMGQPLDQTLSDFQLPAYTQTLREAGRRAAVLVTSGDVLLAFDPAAVAAMDADILGIGMQVSPEVASDFGVFFVPRQAGLAGHDTEQPIAFFLQKPDPETIHRHLDAYDFYVDTGMWLLSVEAVLALFRRCSWQPRKQAFRGRDNLPDYLDLYTEVGTALGSEAPPSPPSLRKAGLDRLRPAVLPMTDARFLHLGNAGQLFDSLDALGSFGPGQPPVVLAATEPSRLHDPGRGRIWLDACGTGPGLACGGNNFLTFLPDGCDPGPLPEGICVDTPPLVPDEETGPADAVCLRVYGVGDAFRGRAETATLCGQPLHAWLAARGESVSARTDIFDTPLFPVLGAGSVDAAWVAGFFATEPDAAWAEAWRAAPRLSPRALMDRIAFDRLLDQRLAGYARAAGETLAAARNGRQSDLARLDFRRLGELLPAEDRAAFASAAGKAPNGLTLPWTRARFHAAGAALAGKKKREALERKAFATLREAIIDSNQAGPVRPERTLKTDQIIWARSPVRLDLAGGWSDTPPFCMEAGGAVFNVAVTLNGQPPIQVFLRPIEEPVLRIGSIDLGLAQTLKTYRDVARFRDPASGFSLPRAAFALAGFHPDFFEGHAFGSLGEQLEALGGGLEMTLLCAVPKGSGLGTSSILAATLLAALNRCCGLGWDRVALYRRVLAMEQLLTTGGGWQDQAGALFPGLKLIETQPGAGQYPTVRYLSSSLLEPPHANQTVLLYYTGITRMAKGILQEIVRNMFLGEARTIRLLEQIRSNAHHAMDAFLYGDPDAVARTIRRYWDQKRRLDAGSSHPAVDRLLNDLDGDLAAATLTGAGGGGYLLMLAKDPDAGLRIRRHLGVQPLNDRARFVDLGVSDTGLEVTVS